MRGLDPFSREFMQLLEQHDEDVQRRLAREACEVALLVRPLDDPRAHNALGYLREGHVGDSQVRRDLERLGEELDEIQFDLQDELDRRDVEVHPEQASSGDAPSEAEYAVAFERARAANALWFALGDDPVRAARDALYTAAAVLDDDLDYEVVGGLADSVFRGEPDAVDQALRLYRERSARQSGE